MYIGLVNLHELNDKNINMFTLLHGFYKYLIQKDEYCVLILGLDAAGKTVRLSTMALKLPNTGNTGPTLCVNRFDNVIIPISLLYCRHTWRRPRPNSHGITKAWIRNTSQQLSAWTLAKSTFMVCDWISGTWADNPNYNRCGTNTTRNHMVWSTWLTRTIAVEWTNQRQCSVSVSIDVAHIQCIYSNRLSSLP